jgi:hypothetical protein
MHRTRSFIKPRRKQARSKGEKGTAYEADDLFHKIELASWLLACSNEQSIGDHAMVAHIPFYSRAEESLELREKGRVFLID